MDIVAEQRERMSLISLFIVAALEERREALASAGLGGEVAFTVDRMSTTLRFERDRVVVREGVTGNPRAHVKGSMEAFLGLARGKMVGAIARREVKVGGNPLAALPLARFFKQTSEGA